MEAKAYEIERVREERLASAICNDASEYDRQFLPAAFAREGDDAYTMIC